MGVIYKEVIRSKRVSFLKGLILVFVSILVINLTMNSAIYSSRYDIEQEIILLTNGLLALYVIIMLYRIVYTQRLCYTYKIIDRELIFEKTLGSTRRVVFSIDMKDVQVLMSAASLDNTGFTGRTYKFSCSSSKNDLYCCIALKDGKKVRLYFEPSKELVRKLVTIMSQRAGQSPAKEKVS